MDINKQTQFVFKDIKVDDALYSFNVTAEDEESAKHKLKIHLTDVIKQLK